MLGIWHPCASGVLAVALGLALCSSPVHASDEYGATIGEALKLLPKRPAQIAVIDANEAKPEVRAALLKLDAFIVKGSQVVYLTKHSEVLQGAHKGSQLHKHILASIIWHEMAHADGADEAEAQRQEEKLWTRFLLNEKVDRITALRYLALLKQRHAA